VTDLAVGQGEFALLTDETAAAVADGRDGPAPDRLTTRGLGPCVGVALAADDAAALLHADGAGGDLPETVGAAVDAIADAAGGFDRARVVTNRPAYAFSDRETVDGAVAAVESRVPAVETTVGTERTPGGSALAVGRDGTVTRPDDAPARRQDDDRLTARLDPGTPALYDRVAAVAGETAATPGDLGLAPDPPTPARDAGRTRD
jgi:hypothetical protein